MLICLFVTGVLIVALVRNYYYPLLAISGEPSAGTWLSGVLLIMSATLSLVAGMDRHPWTWFSVATFFLTLALDERFMFHEQLKEQIIFFTYGRNFPHALYELPVIFGACMGAGVAFLLWSQLSRCGRVVLVCAVSLGLVSVVIDILATGPVLFEDSSKLLAELLVTCALVLNVRSGKTACGKLPMEEN
ncbi:hypothetical protein KK062_03860 [Fulvivirgaceae bacterium PWU5]|uniref:Uncharacterized protein n=1 Tax=Dawidia cretensis TaxID=2782350 RepID=A0AAP2GTF8_9BACT|nr:hypothetical protein [Dawidia cretensis]MBT1707340.1 hypothetical protein [Dawidia cretensis]